MTGYSKIGKVSIEAICDTNITAAEKLAEKYNIKRVYQDYAQMLEKEELDFISICTPNYLHAPISIMALQKGINVHCEKPVAMNAREAMMITEAKNKYGRKLLVALNNRFTNLAFFLKQYSKNDMFGEIYHVNCGWRRRRGIPGNGGWFSDRKLSGGGSLIDLGVHIIDLVIYLMGNPGAISVSGATYCKFADNRSRNSMMFENDYEKVFDVEDTMRRGRHTYESIKAV